MKSHKLTFENKRTCTIECEETGKPLQDKINEAENRFGSPVVKINDKEVKEHSLGGFLLGAVIGGALGNSVAKSGVKKTASKIGSKTKKAVGNAKKDISEFRKASSKKFSNGGKTDKNGFHIEPQFKEGDLVTYNGFDGEIIKVGKDSQGRYYYDVSYSKQGLRVVANYLYNKGNEIKLKNKKFSGGGGVGIKKDWEVIGITMQGKKFKKIITLGRMSDQTDVKNALRRMDLQIREVTSIKELKKYSDGGQIEFKDGFTFKEVSKEYAEKNFQNESIFGINVSQETESLIESKKDLDDFEVFGIELGFKDAYADGGQIPDIIETLVLQENQNVSDPEKMKRKVYENIFSFLPEIQINEIGDISNRYGRNNQEFQRAIREFISKTPYEVKRNYYDSLKPGDILIYDNISDSRNADVRMVSVGTNPEFVYGWSKLFPGWIRVDINKIFVPEYAKEMGFTLSNLREAPKGNEYIDADGGQIPDIIETLVLQENQNVSDPKKMKRKVYENIFSFLPEIQINEIGDISNRYGRNNQELQQAIREFIRKTPYEVKRNYYDSLNPGDILIYDNIGSYRRGKIILVTVGTNPEFVYGWSKFFPGWIEVDINKIFVPEYAKEMGFTLSNLREAPKETDFEIYADGGLIGKTAIFERYGEQKMGTITEDLGNGKLVVVSGMGQYAVTPDNLISITEPIEKKGFFSFGEGGKLKYNRSWHQDHYRHNKAESYEKPMSERSKKFAQGGKVGDFFYDTRKDKTFQVIFEDGDKMGILYMDKSKKPDGKVETISKNEFEYYVQMSAWRKYQQEYGEGGGLTKDKYLVLAELYNLYHKGYSTVQLNGFSESIGYVIGLQLDDTEIKKVGERAYITLYSKGGSTEYNRSWHQDHNRHNKAESYEKPMSERSKKYSGGGGVGTWKENKQKKIKELTKQINEVNEYLKNLENINTEQAYLETKNLIEYKSILEAQLLHLTDEYSNGGGISSVKKYRLLSPDGFDIEMDKVYTEEELMPAFEAFKKRFEKQGYYSTGNRERINLSDLGDYMTVIEINEFEDYD